MASAPLTSWQIDGETMEAVETATDFIFLGSKITAYGDCSHEMFASWKKSYDKSWQNMKKQRHYFANKGPSGQSYGFSSSHVWMWELDYKESWALKNWCFWIMVLEKTLESSLDCKETKPVNPKGNQSWIFTGRTDAETETPIFWPSDAMSRLIWKAPDAGKDWRQKKGVTGWVGWISPPNWVSDSSLSCVWLCVTPWTAVHQVPLSMGFFRQAYWSGFQCPPPGGLPDAGIELATCPLPFVNWVTLGKLLNLSMPQFSHQ